MTRSSRLSWLVLAAALFVVPPALADDYLVYNDGGLPLRTDIWTWCDAGQPCDVQGFQSCRTPEGSDSLRVNTNQWGGWGVFYLDEAGQNTIREDLSAFFGGEIRFWVKSPYSTVTVEFQCEEAGVVQGFGTNIGAAGYDGSNTWQELVIPVANFINGDTGLPATAECLATTNAAFMSTLADLPFFSSFQVDNVRWRKATPHPGPSDVQVQGRQLVVEGEPFVVNGMAYAPISIGENFAGALKDRPDRYLVDLPQIAASGANAIRIYSTFATKGMLDAAWENGLYVIPTFLPNKLQLTCPEGRDFMTQQVIDVVNQIKDHPAVLFWLLGNEFNLELTSAELCDAATGWYPQLDALAEAIELAGAPQPVGTANADTSGLGDICLAGCSDDTALPNVDLWGVQLYRGCSFGTAFVAYEKPDCGRPMVITEFGADAWDGVMGQEDETMQADCLGQLLSEADRALAVRTPGGVSSGQIVFEWADEWWKANPDASVPDNTCVDGATAWDTHDTCASFTNLNYPDPNINEEWWGVVSVDPADPDARGLREAYDRVTETWLLGPVRDLLIDTYNRATGDTDLSFDPAAGSADHTLYYGPLNAVSSYGYSAAIGGLGATGSASATVPVADDLFWLVAPRNGAEGCYGTSSAGAERPCFPDGSSCSVAQAASRTCE